MALAPVSHDDWRAGIEPMACVMLSFSDRLALLSNMDTASHTAIALKLANTARRFALFSLYELTTALETLDAPAHPALAHKLNTVRRAIIATARADTAPVFTDWPADLPCPLDLD